MFGFILGVAICFGLTYLLSVSPATARLREGKGELAGFFNNPIFVGMMVGGTLSLIFSGSVSLVLLNIGLGAWVGLGVQYVKERTSEN
jgi:hypothetical protein